MTLQKPQVGRLWKLPFPLATHMTITSHGSRTGVPITTTVYPMHYQHVRVARREFAAARQRLQETARDG